MAVPPRLFHNREAERRVLEQALASPRSELLILYGRRGVGKTALLERALGQVSAPPIFYRATHRTLPLQLASLTKAAREARPGAFLGQPFASIPVFLEFLSHQAQAVAPRPVVVVIDELPYLADTEPGLLQELQHWWDANRDRPNLRRFLAGSWVSFMWSSRSGN